MAPRFKGILFVVVAVIAAATQISYEDATSNLASWWRALPLGKEVPAWLTPGIDNLVLWVCLVILVALLLAPRGFRFWKRRRNDPRRISGWSADIPHQFQIETEPQKVANPPEPNEYSAAEIAAEMSRNHPKDYTPEMVARMYRDRGFKVRTVTERVYPKGTGVLEQAAIDILGSHEVRYHYWIRSADRARFELGESNWITLRDAAIRAYEETQKNSLHSLLAERFSDGGVENWYAHHLIYNECREPAIRVFGTKAPSTRQMEIPKDHLKAGRLQDRAARLDPDGDGAPTYSNLQIYVDEFLQRLEEIKQHPMGKETHGDG